MGINSNYLSGKDGLASYLRSCVSKFNPLPTVPTGLTSSQALIYLCLKWAMGVPWLLLPASCSGITSSLEARGLGRLGGREGLFSA